MKNEHRVLTPESVEFVYELGGLGSRMIAAAIDHLIVLTGLLALWVGGCFLAGFASLFVGAVVAVAIAGTFVLYFGYFAYFEWKWNGQTPGKRMMDLRVIDDRGMSVDAFQSLTRNLFRIVDMMPFLFALDFISIGFYGLGGIAAWLSPQQKRLGDWAAGTLVIRTQKRVMPGAIIAPNGAVEGDSVRVVDSLDLDVLADKRYLGKSDQYRNAEPVLFITRAGRDLLVEMGEL